VLFALIEEIAKSSIEDKFYANLIKSFIKRNFLIYERSSVISPKEVGISYNKIKQIYIDDFLKYLKELNFIFTLHNENKFMTDLIIYLVKILYDGDSSQNFNYYLNQETKNIYSYTNNYHNSCVNSYTNNNISKKINKNTR